MQGDSVFFIQMAGKLDETLKNAEEYRNIFGISRKDAEADVAVYTDCREKAILGDKSSRNFILNQYVRILMSGISGMNGKKLSQMINFDNLQENKANILFEMLLESTDISVIIDRYEIKVRFEEKELRRVIDCESPALLEIYKNEIKRYKLLATLIYSKEYGQDCIDTLHFTF